MHTISKEFHFSASHVLVGLPDCHPCGRLHGHNYILKVILKGSPNSKGFVQDYGELKPIQEFIDQNLDHKHLNDFFPFQPSVELMTENLFHFFKKDYPMLHAVEMSETPKTNCRYEE